jgi:SAM-dependent methyltransferase
MDTVVCVNVLEHIEYDGAALESIRTVLEPGGRLILLVPNDPKAYGTIDREIGHYRRYTTSGLRSLIESAGYEIEEMRSFNRISMPGWRIAGQLLKGKTISRLALGVFDRFVWLWRKIDGSLPWQPVSIVAIARRKC